MIPYLALNLQLLVHRPQLLRYNLISPSEIPTILLCSQVGRCNRCLRMLRTLVELLDALGTLRNDSTTTDSSIANDGRVRHGSGSSVGENLSRAVERSGEVRLCVHVQPPAAGAARPVPL